VFHIYIYIYMYICVCVFVCVCVCVCGAGMLTVLLNRMGDLALLMVIAWIVDFGSLRFIYYMEF
jgi:hypothetical protein